MKIANRLLVLGMCLSSLCAPFAVAETVTYKYDALGRLVSAERTAGTTNGVATTLAYDAAGNRSHVTVVGVPALTTIGYPPAIQGSTISSSASEPSSSCGGIVGPALTNGATISATRPASGTGWLIMGFSLNSDRCENAGLNQRYMIYVADDGTLYWEEDGPPADAVYHTAARHLRMVYSGTTLTVYDDGAVLFTRQVAAGQTLYPKFLFFDPNVTITNASIGH